jgi:hypothetical protein
MFSNNSICEFFEYLKPQSIMKCTIHVNSTKKHVRQNLEKDIGESMHFVSDEKGNLLVYPSSLSMPGKHT